MHRFFFAVSCGLILVWFVGCSDSPKGAATSARVKGTVKMDGKTVPVGELHFAIPGFPPRIVEIKDGAFEGEAPVGKNKVELFIYVEGPASEKYKGTTTKINVAPEKYWGPNTTLEANVNAGAKNEVKFDLSK